MIIIAQRNNLHKIAYDYCIQALKIKNNSTTILFKESDIYNWRILDALSISAFHLNEMDIFKNCIDELLSEDVSKYISDNELIRIRKNQELLKNN